MGLFTKAIGPVFLKSSNQAEDYINKLKELQGRCPGELKEEIEKQIAIAEYGLKGEQSVAFELKNSGIDMYILQDICLKYGDLSAQIDYLIVTRKRTYIIECKNLIGDIEINNSGEFIRTYQLKGKKIREGTYSPITQNLRHLQIIKEIRKASKGNIISRKLFESSFEDNYKSIVVLANPKTILNARYAKKGMSDIANFFFNNNQSERYDYTEKYEGLLKKVEELKENSISGEDDLKAVLRAELKAFRLNRSRQENVKAYFIFNDAQMEDLLEKSPKNKAELCQVSGFGKVKAEKYGDEILEILRKTR